MLRDVWKAKLPLKIRFFIWQVLNDKLQSAKQLVKRGWPGEIGCKMCGVSKSTDHLIFRCVVMNFVWNVCAEEFGWDRVPSSGCDFLTNLLEVFSKKKRMQRIFILGCTDWGLWLIRNDFVFSAKLRSGDEIQLNRSI